MASSCQATSHYLNQCWLSSMSWWCHQMETFSAVLALCAGNSQVTGKFPTQRPVTQSFDIFFDLCLNKQFSKQSWDWWFETPSYSGVLNCSCHISDLHNFIGAATRWYAPLRKQCHIFYRSYRNFDDAEFCSAVSSAPFHVCEIFDHIEDMAWFTSSLLSAIINEHAPMKRKLVKQESVPYLNAHLQKAMYRWNMARNKFHLYGKQYWHENRRQGNLVVSLGKQSLRKYFSEKCSKKDKKFWKTISPFMTNKNTRNRNNIILRENYNTVVDSYEVCEIFNDYFANIASSVGFEDGITSVDAAIQKHNRHPSVVMIRDNFTELKRSHFELYLQMISAISWSLLTLKRLLGMIIYREKSYT